MIAPRDRVRPLSLLDAMIVVASVALWLVVTRSYAQRSNLVSIWYLGDSALVRILRNQGGFFLIFSTLTMLLIRLRAPRPPRRRLWRQPGLAASAGATAGIMIGVLGVLAKWSASLEHSVADVTRFFYAARPFAAPGVLGAWLALALTGRWKSEAGTIDRLGRLLGILWLFEFVIAEMPTVRWIDIIFGLIRRWHR